MGSRATPADIAAFVARTGATVGPAASLPVPVDDRATVGAITLCLPWPPSVNHLRVPIVTGKRVKMVTSARGRAYQKNVAAVVFAAGCVKVEGRLAVRITACPPTRRKADLDNLLKCLLDSLQEAGLFDDDGQIDEILIQRGEVVKGGLLMVRITERVEG